MSHESFDKIIAMWCILLVLASAAKASHSAFNTTDVIVTYEGHADAGPQQYRETVTNTGVRKESDRIERYGERKGDKLRSDVREDRKGPIGQDSDYLENVGTTEPSDGVIFVPSGNREPQFTSGRRGGEAQRISVNDVVERVAVGDIINERVRVTESPNKDGVYFKPGKNNEQTELQIKREQDERIEKNLKDFKEITESPIDCHNLNCENVVESVCGVKLQNKRPKYRLFMNECFFRKVNCGLRYDYNRYTPVPLEKCDGVGSHTPLGSERPVWINYNNPLPPSSGRRSGDNRQNKPQNMPSRRAMTSGMTGLACDHMCPVRCPDQYNPVCAHSFPMKRKVFQNHCLLDLQSCNDGSEWHERPLSDCAGVLTAEVHERAAFIGWMQRMGILDKKGHLVM